MHHPIRVVEDSLRHLGESYLAVDKLLHDGESPLGRRFALGPHRSEYGINSLLTLYAAAFIEEWNCTDRKHLGSGHGVLLTLFYYFFASAGRIISAIKGAFPEAFSTFFNRTDAPGSGSVA
jgi:hypothetical protein